MIEVKGLTRYYGRNKDVTKALDGVDFTLDDSGLVFIVGKSGSGKSTLLNLLCGLDDATSGSIFVNGTDICTLKPHELDNYRNYFVGIIYQNYNLFEDDTVINNIKLSSDIAENSVSDEEILEIIEKVDLKGKENSLVRQLSGGQKQRVAVARALIKNPHMIIADEPTGNLDTRTSALIFDMLKDISQEKLVVIVSHDMESARTYGDRIIEISDGRIVSDLEKNEIYSTEYESIEISRTCLITDERIDEINETIKDKGAKLLKSDEKYVPFTREVISKEGKADFSGKNKSWKNSFVLSLKFFSSAWISLIFAVVLSSIIIGLLVIANQFINFDGDKNTITMAEEYGVQSSIYNKAISDVNNSQGINKNRLSIVTQADIQKFKDAGYTGNIYPVYAAPVYNGTELLEKIQIDTTLRIYAKSALGLMVTDMDYLNKIFNGVEVVAGTLAGAEESTSVIVTDYFADSILYNNQVKRKDNASIYSSDPNDIYQNLLGCKLSDRYTIGAIIKTDYKEKYEHVLNVAKRLQEDKANASALSEEFYKSQLFIKFNEEVNSALAIAYSVNPDFMDEYLSGNDVGHFYMQGITASGNDGMLGSYSHDHWTASDKSIKDGEILVRNITFSNMFPGVKLDEGSNVYITIKQYGPEQNSASDKPLYQKKFKITGTFSPPGNENNVFRMSVNDAKEFMRNAYPIYALCFDDLTQQTIVDKVATSNNFYSRSKVIAAVLELSGIVHIFASLFTYITVILIIAIAVFVVFYSLRVVRKNQYRLGVYKSLGYSMLALENASLLNNLYLIVSIFIVTIIASSLMSGVANGLMIQAFIDYFGNDIYTGFSFFTFSMPTISMFVGIIAALILISTFVPILAIRRIKPNVIINKAE